MKKRLISSDHGANSAKVGKDRKPTDYVIKSAPGLRLRVSSGGTKTWSLVFTRTSDGRKRRVNLGHYPAMSLAEAKKRSVQARAGITTGADPAAERADAKKADTFETLAELYIENWARRKKRSWREDERVLKHDVLPAIGQMKAEMVHKRDIARILDKIAARGSGYMANRTHALLRKVFNWAKKEGHLDVLPDLDLNLRGDESERKRVLCDEEICRVWHGLDESPMTRPLQIALKLALVLGQRLNEAGLARKSEFDLGERLWTMPGERSMPAERKGRSASGAKNKRPHLVPLPAAAIELLKEAIGLSGGSEWLIPGENDACPIGDTALSRAWGRARIELGIPDAQAKDFRRTVSTGLGNLGAEDFWVGVILNHKTVRGQVTGKHYNHAAYLPEKRAWLERWAEKLMEVVAE